MHRCTAFDNANAKLIFFLSFFRKHGCFKSKRSTLLTTYVMKDKCKHFSHSLYIRRVSYQSLLFPFLNWFKLLLYGPFGPNTQLRRINTTNCEVTNEAIPKKQKMKQTIHSFFFPWTSRKESNVPKCKNS